MGGPTDKTQFPEAHGRTNKPSTSTGTGIGAEQSVGVHALDAVLALGSPTPPEVARVMAKYPADRDAMMTRLQHTVGNGFVQQVIAVMQTVHSTDITDRAHDALALTDGVRRTLFPAYRLAVDAVDPLAAMELAHDIVQIIKVAEHTRREVEAALTAGSATIDSTYVELAMLKARFATDLDQLVIELSMQMGAQ